MKLNLNNKMSLYRAGKFFNCYNEDGIIIHFLFGYKYITYRKCAGFPESALTKVKTKLQEEKISYEVYDKYVVTEKYHGLNKKYNETLKKALKSLEIEQRLERIKEKLEKFDLEQLEKVLEAIESGQYE